MFAKSESGESNARFGRAGIQGLAWGAIAVHLVTVRWTPDCGGVAYGFPFAYATTSLASSLQFDVSVLRLIADWLIYSACAAGVVWLLLRGRSSRASTRARAGTWLPWLAACFVTVSTHLNYEPRIAHSEHPHVHEWRAVEPYFGLPRWRSHLERLCD